MVDNINPMVEVFKNRIEFSNAGAPLVAIERIVDSVPVSRNENIAGFMHKCGICKVMDPDTAPRYKKYIPYWA